MQLKATTSKSKYSVANFEEVGHSFLEEVYSTVLMEDIQPELVLNWDQTGIKIVPASSWTMEQRGVNRVDMVGLNDKRQITAIFCASLLGDFYQYSLTMLEKQLIAI